MERRIRHNTHPGEILREEIVNAYSLTVDQTAVLLQIPPTVLSGILNETSAITPNIAIRISKVFGGNASLWIRMQASYDMRKEEEAFEHSNISLSRYEFA